MDLIYMNAKKEDIGVLFNYTFDLAYGISENDFELTTNINNHVCQSGNILYIEGTEYGGIIDRIRVDTDKDLLRYIGRTWHGILNTKVIEPDAGADYYVANGEANAIIGDLIVRMGLDKLFKASSVDSGLVVKNYNMNRYILGYEGIKKMLRTVNGKLKFNFQNGFVVLSAEPIVDYSQDDEFDSSQIDFIVEKNYKPTNHVICLGSGELKNRVVIHLYADSRGNISTTQSLFGLEEVAKIYDNALAESDEELILKGMEVLMESWNADILQLNLDSAKSYDIGDIVGARENATGIFLAREITKKIVTIHDDVVTITHKVGE